MLAKRNMQIASLILIGISAFPCLWTLFNTPPVIMYAIERQENAALRIILPLLLAGLINGIGFVILFLSVIIRPRP